MRRINWPRLWRTYWVCCECRMLDSLQFHHWRHVTVWSITQHSLAVLGIFVGTLLVYIGTWWFLNLYTRSATIHLFTEQLFTDPVGQIPLYNWSVAKNGQAHSRIADLYYFYRPPNQGTKEAMKNYFCAKFFIGHRTIDFRKIIFCAKFSKAPWFTESKLLTIKRIRKFSKWDVTLFPKWANLG